MHCIYNRFTWLRDPTSIFLNRIYTSFSNFAFIFAMKHSFFLSEDGGKNPFDWGTSICTYNSFTVCCFEMKRRSFLRMLNFDVSIIIIVGVVGVVSISFQVTAACHNHFSFLLSTLFFFHFAHCVCVCALLLPFSFFIRRSPFFLYFLFSLVFKYMRNKKFVYYKLSSPIFFLLDSTMDAQKNGKTLFRESSIEFGFFLLLNVNQSTLISAVRMN